MIRWILFLFVVHVAADVFNECREENYRYLLAAGGPTSSYGLNITIHEEVNNKIDYVQCIRTCSGLAHCNYFISAGGMCYYGIETGQDDGGLTSSLFSTSGEDVYVRQDTCAYNKCVNNGACVDGLYTYSCQCIFGFVGRYCEEIVPLALAPGSRNWFDAVEYCNSFARSLVTVDSAEKLTIVTDVMAAYTAAGSTSDCGAWYWSSMFRVGPGQWLWNNVSSDYVTEMFQRNGGLPADYWNVALLNEGWDWQLDDGSQLDHHCHLCEV